MAAITAPTDVRPGSTIRGTPPVEYGATIGLGKVVYLDAATGTHKLAANNSTLAIAAAVGIAVTPGASTDYGFIAATDGAYLTFTGSTFVIGDTYFLGTSGNIIPQGDIATGNYVTRIGTAATATILQVSIKATGIPHA